MKALYRVKIRSIAGKGRILFLWGLLLGVMGRWEAGLYAQSPAQILLADEMRRLEETVKIAKGSSGERQEAFIRLAQLFQLTGNLEGAAKAWNDAALADPQNQHDPALLEGAFCLVALGEMDQAETQVTPLLQSPHPGTRLKARYLHAQIQAFRSGELAPLRALLEDPDYERYMPGIYYTLWKLSAIELYKTRLLSLYPQSPEARIVTPGASPGGTVSPWPLALWLLFPGREQVTLTAAVQDAGENSPPAATDKEAQVLQAGLFSKEANAQAMAAQLKDAGFDAAVVPRTVKGTAYWVVTVLPGPDIQKTMVQLQEKGFASFPVF
ncbi:MAG: SPOR domain-containing protein [Treponema sp.]|nr:SPOR domain-containing protein [Treponema sp.]